MRISDWSSDVCSSDLRHTISRLYGGHVRAVLDSHIITRLARDIRPSFAAAALGIAINEHSLGTGRLGARRGRRAILIAGRRRARGRIACRTRHPRSARNQAEKMTARHRIFHVLYTLEWLSSVHFRPPAPR